jgi:predicted secreted protein
MTPLDSRLRGNDRKVVVPANAGIQRRWFSALALTALLTACGGPRGLYWPVVPPDLPAPRLVTTDADGSSVDIVRTQWLIVRLPTDAPPGNRWIMELGKDRVLYPSGDTPRDAQAANGGAPATEFVLRAEGTGTTSVRFVYRNPDEPQTPPARTVAFEVVAR